MQYSRDMRSAGGLRGPAEGDVVALQGGPGRAVRRLPAVGAAGAGPGAEAAQGR